MASDLAVDDQIFGGFQAAIDGGTRRNPCGAAGSALCRHSSIMGRRRRLEARGQISIFYFGPAELENRDLTPFPSSSTAAAGEVARLSIELALLAFAAEGLVQAL